MTVDDDPAVSRSVARDLRRRYGKDYRIIRADSGADALDALRETKLRCDAVAATLADYRRRRRPLPAQAVEPARGEALPGGRLAGGDLARDRGPAGRGDQGHRPSLVFAVLSGPRLPGPQFG